MTANYETDGFSDDRMLIVFFGTTTIASFFFFKLSTLFIKWFFFGKFRFLTTNFFEDEKKCIKSGKHSAHMNDNRKFRYVNDSISLINSILCVLGVMYFIIRYHNVNEYYPLIYTHPIGYFLCAIIGYLLCDTTELIANEYSSRVIVLVIHHFLFGVGCLYPMIVNKYGGLVIIGLLMKGNGVFLCIRALLKYHKYSKDKLGYKMFALTNISTFIIFRILPNVYLCVFCIDHYPTFDLASKFIFVIITFGLLIINLIVFIQLLVSDKFITLSKEYQINDKSDCSTSTSKTSIGPSDATTTASTNSSTNKTLSSDVVTVMISTDDYTIASTNSKYSDATPTTESSLSTTTPTTTVKS